MSKSIKLFKSLFSIMFDGKSTQTVDHCLNCVCILSTVAAYCPEIHL